MRIVGICTIEASQILENDDADDVKSFLSSRTVNFEASHAPLTYRLTDRSSKLGCVCVSVGHPSDEITNVAWSISASQNYVFKFLKKAVDNPTTLTLAMGLAREMAQDADHDPELAEASSNPPNEEEKNAGEGSGQAEEKENLGFFQRLFGGGKGSSKSQTTSNQGNSLTTNEMSASKTEMDDDESDMNLGNKGSKLSVEDFDLLKVVGKGAFGKVMLVRKKTGVEEGSIYAMKVLKKSVIVAKGQVEHTKSERSILMEIKHPYVVGLRFAFQVFFIYFEKREGRLNNLSSTIFHISL